MNSQLSIALVGYGNMGQEIDALAKRDGITVVERYDITKPLVKTLPPFDVAIDFTMPSVVLGNIKLLAEAGKNIVVGTTGWNEHLSEVKKIVEKNNVGLVYASNFSIGVNLFMDVVAEAAKRFSRHEAYDVAIHETHHNKKKDRPSGTALSLAELVLKNFPRKKKIVTPEGEMKPDELEVSSSRIGTVAGTHTVTFESAMDSIALTHTAKTRTSFAAGALLAAKWVKGKKGLYTFADVLKEV